MKGEKFSTDIECFPPHDIVGSAVAKVMIKAAGKNGESTANVLNKLILDSKNVLEKHIVNKERKKKGKNIANMIWPWSQGKRPSMKTFQELYN